jgi:hypothetical protein
MFEGVYQTPIIDWFISVLGNGTHDPLPPIIVGLVALNETNIWK